MKTYLRTFPLMVLLCGLFAYLFYDLIMGLNVLIFDLVLLAVVRRLRPQLRHRRVFWLATVALLLSAVSVVVVGQVASFYVHAVSYLLLVGLAQSRELRFVWYALILGTSSLAFAPMRAWRERRWRVSETSDRRGVRKWATQLFLPLMITLPFYVLYASGSSHFTNGIETVTDWLFGWTYDASIFYILFLMMVGSVLTLPYFYTGDEFAISAAEQQLSPRTERNRNRRLIGFSPLGLITEYRRGVITLALLNLLLLANNLTDLGYLYISTATQTAADLSEFVHAGTNALVCSILLAMAIVLYLFRGNLNFYYGSKRLRSLTYLWLTQNAFLAISVGLRTWYYVSAYGLAYGRIYVFFFLLLIVFGLFSLVRKVSFRLSFSRLLQVNGIAAWAALMIYASVNWSGVITRANLAQSPERIDWNYLINELDDRNTFLLLPHKGELSARQRKQLEVNKKRAGTDAALMDFRSWNYSNYRNR